MDLSLLDRITPLVAIMARERTAERPDLYDDARQEGLIRAWQRAEQKPDQKDAYYYVAARGAVNDTVRGRPAFGAESHRGRQDAHDLSDPLVRTTGDGGEQLVADPEDLSTSDAIGATEVRQTIREAVAHLEEKDRLLVFLRYWEDMGFAEASKVLGRSANALELRWRQQIRPQLREELSKLAA